MYIYIYIYIYAHIYIYICICIHTHTHVVLEERAADAQGLGQVGAAHEEALLNIICYTIISYHMM